MKDRRLQIKESLEGMIYGQRHRDFQRLALQLAKTKWPELEATHEQDDGGEDATSFFVGADGVRRRLACSLTGTLDKVRKDAARLKVRKVQLDILVFMTPVAVTNLTISAWCEAIQNEFGHGLHIIPESELIALLEQPQNSWLCRDYLCLDFADQPALAELEASARAAAGELLGGWKTEYRFDGAKAIELGLVREPAESEKDRPRQAQLAPVSFQHVGKLIAEGDRILLIGPPGAGKTFTLIQAADFLLQLEKARVPILVSLPGWAASGTDFLSYVAKQLEGYGLKADGVVKLVNAGRIVFLLNGWNEIPDDFADAGTAQLRAFVLNNPAAALILSTRQGRVASPLSSAIVIRVRPLSSQQKLDIVRRSELDNPSALIRELETNGALAEVTDAPLFLAAIIGLERAGVPLPSTRSRIFEKFIEQIEGSSEHSAALSAAPCGGLHRHYISHTAVAMIRSGRTILAFDELLTAIAECSRTLQHQGYLTSAPHSAAVADCLVKHHLLVLSRSMGGDYRFVHQQFQEWFAAEWLHSHVVALATNERPDAIFALQRDVLNHARWQQPLWFLLERLAQGGGEQLRAAASLIHWAMQVDLVLAAELAGIAGPPVWPFMRDDLGKSLRKWYARNSERHRKCALAAMLATRAPDFQDVLWPLLESPDQQVRLCTCRTWHPFPLASLGADWRQHFEKWDAQRRVEFIQEMGSQSGQEHITFACELAKTDKNLDVRLACLRLLNDAGASQTCAEIVSAPEFGEWAQGLTNELVPRLPKRCLGPLVPRLKAALADQQNVNDRYAVIGVLHSLDDPDSQNLMKAEMDRILKMDSVALSPSNDWLGPAEQKPKQPNAAPIIAQYLEAVHRVSPAWAMNWLGDQLMQGRLWWEPFTDYLAEMPEPTLQELASAALNADLDVNTVSSRARVLGRSGSSIAAKAILDQWLAWDAKKEARRPEESFNRGDALRGGLHEVPLPVLVDVVIQESNGVEDFQRLRDLLGCVMPSAALDSALRVQLSQQQRDSLRSLALRLEQIKPAELIELRRFRAHQAVLVGAVGKPQDAQILEVWIRDEIRFRAEEDAAWKAKYEAWEAGGRKTRFPGGRGITVYWNWYQGALVQLGCQEAAEVCLGLLNFPELVGEAAWGLVLLAQNNDGELSSAFAHHPEYSKIYERRTAKRANVVSETARRYADAIFNAVQSSFAELDKAGSKFPMHELAKTVSALASLDDLRAMPFLQSISSDRYSGWAVAEALHGLVVRGVVISGEEAAQALEPFIAEHEKEPRGGEQDSWYEVARCLAALLFSDTPSAGTERIRRLPPQRIKSYHVREILRLLGACQAPEAADLLIELAGVLEIHRHCFYELVTAMSNNVNAKAQRYLLELFDRLCSGELPRGHDTVDPLAKAIARAAKLDNTIRAGIKAGCRSVSSALQRQVLARILVEIGDDDSALMLCDLVHDEFPITYDVERLVEAIATTHVAAGGSSYYIKPREASHLKKRLLEIALKDLTRRTSSLELLAVITQCRLEHGLPGNEPIHPDIEAIRQNPVPWQLLGVTGESR